MNHKLAMGKVVQGENLNYLLIKDDYGNSRSVEHNLNYEICKLLREKYMDKFVAIDLKVTVMGNHR
jgi:hypothetical protein